jgi:hypothetical protein
MDPNLKYFTKCKDLCHRWISGHLKKKRYNYTCTLSNCARRYSLNCLILIKTILSTIAGTWKMQILLLVLSSNVQIIWLKQIYVIITNRKTFPQYANHDDDEIDSDWTLSTEKKCVDNASSAVSRFQRD